MTINLTIYYAFNLLYKHLTTNLNFLNYVLTNYTLHYLTNQSTTNIYLEGAFLPELGVECHVALRPSPRLLVERLAHFERGRVNVEGDSCVAR